MCLRFVLLLAALYSFGLVSLGLGSAGQAVAAERTWSDASGKFQVEAELVSVADGKVWLKKPDGKVISVPVSRLSEADQTFLKAEDGEPANGEASANAPLKVGDKAYLRVKGQWQLAKITAINDGPASAKYEIALLTGERRDMRVTEKRLRPYGKAGAGGLLLPGDVVEIVDRWNKGEPKQGTIVRVKGSSSAYVKVEGALGEKSYWLKDLRPPGSAEGASLAGRVKSAKESNRKPGQAPHPSDSIVYPEEPKLAEVNLAAAEPVDLSGGSSVATLITLDATPKPFDFKNLRPFPIKLIPKQDSWDKLDSISVARDGDLAAIFRISRDKKKQLELAPLRKSRASTKLLGLLPTTTRIELSPSGDWLMTQRTKPAAIDIWRVKWTPNEDPDKQRQRVEGIEHHISWMPNPEADSWYKVKMAGWLDDQTVMTVDSKSQAIAWQAESATPQHRLEIPKHHAFLPGTSYLAINRDSRGVCLLDLATMKTLAVIGKDEVMPGTPSISPSGRWLLISGAHGILEFWDLTKGEKVLQTVLLSPKGKPSSWRTKWSQEEEFILAGNHPTSIQSWKPVALNSLAKRTATGVVWSFSKGRGGVPLLSATRTLSPEAKEPIEVNSGGPFILKRGDGIAIDVQVDAKITAATRERIAEMIEEQGYRVADNSPFVIQARTTMETKSQEYGTNFAQAGEKGNFTVSYQVRNYTLSLIHNGQQLWQTGGGQSPGVPQLFTNEKAVREAASEPMEPAASFFTKITLPETVMVVQ